MIKTFATFALFVVASIAWSAPALKEKPPQAPKLDNTVWVGQTYEKQEMTIYFHPEGKMRICYAGTDFETASWKQDGKKIYIEMNNKYCEFNGEMTKNVISGESFNVGGLKWQTTLTQQPDAKMKPLRGMVEQQEFPDRLKR